MKLSLACELSKVLLNKIYVYDIRVKIILVQHWFTNGHNNIHTDLRKKFCKAQTIRFLSFCFSNIFWNACFVFIRSFPTWNCGRVARIMSMKGDRRTVKLSKQFLFGPLRGLTWELVKSVSFCVLHEENNYVYCLSPWWTYSPRTTCSVCTSYMPDAWSWIKVLKNTWTDVHYEWCLYFHHFGFTSGAVVCKKTATRRRFAAAFGNFFKSSTPTAALVTILGYSRISFVPLMSMSRLTLEVFHNILRKRQIKNVHVKDVYTVVVYILPSQRSTHVQFPVRDYHYSSSYSCYYLYSY